MTNYDILKEYEAHQTPVPSYEEWIGLKQQRDLENKLRHDSDNKNWQLRTKNAQLKELLSECLAHLTLGEEGASVTPLNIVIDNIKEVLR